MLPWPIYLLSPVLKADTFANLLWNNERKPMVYSCLIWWQNIVPFFWKFYIGFMNIRPRHIFGHGIQGTVKPPWPRNGTLNLYRLVVALATSASPQIFNSYFSPDASHWAVWLSMSSIASFRLKDLWVMSPTLSHWATVLHKWGGFRKHDLFVLLILILFDSSIWPVIVKYVILSLLLLKKWVYNFVGT